MAIINKPSSFKGYSVWHEINLGSVTSRRQMAYSNWVVEVEFDAENIYKGCTRCREATRIRQDPSTSKTIPTLQPERWSGEW